MGRTSGRKGAVWRRLSQQVIAHAVAYGTPCPGCGQLIDPPGRWPERHPRSPSVDHIVPLSVDPSRGNDPTNLRAMHYGCNVQRGNSMRGRLTRTW